MSEHAIAPSLGRASGIQDEGEAAFVTLFLKAIRRRRPLIASVVTVCVVAAIIAVLVIPPRYRAEASINLDFRRVKLPQASYAAGEAPVEQQTMWVETWQEAERIVSWPLLKNLSDRLDLAHDPELAPPNAHGGTEARQILTTLRRIASQYTADAGRWLRTVIDDGSVHSPEVLQPDAMGQLLDRVSRRFVVQPGAKSSVIHITYWSANPQRAAEVVNALLDVYLEEQQARRQMELHNAVTWIDAQILRLAETAAAADRAAEQYRASERLFDIRGNDSMSERLGYLIKELNFATADEVFLASKVTQIDALQKAGQNGLDSAPDVVGSPLIQRLKINESDLSRQVEALAAAHADFAPSAADPKFPLLRNLRDQLRNIRARIVEEEKHIADGLRGQLQSARLRLSALRVSTEGAEEGVVHAKQSEVDLRRLEREAEANRSAYKSFLERSQEMRANLSLQQGQATVFAAAAIPISPAFPGKTTVVVFVLISSLIGACILAILLEAHNTGFYSPDDIENKLGLPCVGIIPQFKGRALRSLGRGISPGGSEAQFERDLLSSISLEVERLLEIGARTLLITSAVPTEGKTSTVLLLARMEASRGYRVLMIDCDTLRRTLTSRFQGSSLVGLSQVLNGEAAWTEAVQRDPYSDADILRASAAEGGSARARAGAMQHLLREVSGRYDLILIDSSPILSRTDVRLLGALVDRVLLVVRWREIPRSFVEKAIRSLNRGQIGVVGCILTQVKMRSFLAHDARELRYAEAYYGKGKCIGTDFKA